MIKNALAFIMAGVWQLTAGAAGLPLTMHAAAFEKGGGPEVIEIHDVPVPRLAPEEVLVAVKAAGVASWDADVRRGIGDKASSPVILGSDGAGTVVAVGSRVKDFKVGDSVYGTANGFYAEFVKVRSDRIARVPKHMSFLEAGILAISGLSALQAIDDVLRLREGETLIIHGAAGGVGSMAVQLAKLRGVKVLATAIDSQGMEFAQRLGADVVVNGMKDDIASFAKAFAPNGVDAVLGLAGGAALETCIDALRREGRGRVAYLYGINPVPRPRSGIRMTLFSFAPGSAELQKLNRAVQQGKLQVPVAAEYALGAAAEAHKRLEGGHLEGKIVLRTNES